jgi:hypothetical protein
MITLTGWLYNFFAGAVAGRLTGPAMGAVARPARAAILYLLLFTWLSSACQTVAPQATATVTPVAATATAPSEIVPTEVVDGPTAVPPLGPPAGAATLPTAEPVGTAAAATAPPLLTAAPAVLIDGPYEATYFRGFAEAPITLIDYSDFL